jgi:hypothetical protein
VGLAAGLGAGLEHATMTTSHSERIPIP